MKAQAVIFDIYNTLLEVLPAPPDAEARWQRLCRERLGLGQPPTLGEVEARCAQIIAREHATARSQGIQCPEIYWPDIMTEALPALQKLSTAEAAEVRFEHVRLLRTLRLMDGAAPVLRALQQKGVWLGMASNCQPYTLRELDEHLGGIGLDRSLFEPAFCFLSFEYGFSKPNPHAFRILTARLWCRGVGADRILMVGDREDNDIAPARAQGWQTWRLTAEVTDEPQAGTWSQLGEQLGV